MSNGAVSEGFGAMPMDHYEKGQADVGELSDLATVNKESAPRSDAGSFGWRSSLLRSDDVADKREADNDASRRLPMLKGGTGGGGLSVGKDGGIAARADEAPTTFESLSYVYDVPTPEAQQAVLKTFEQTLRDNQIVLEDAPADPAAPPAGARPAAEPLAAGRPVAQAGEKKQLDPQPQDRVYVIEAKQWQLANTIHSLDNLSAQSETARPEIMQRTRQLQDLQKQQLQVEGRVEPAREKELLLQDGERKKAVLGESVRPSSEANYGLNRSQAVRLRTGFAEQSGNERGSVFYAQPPAPPAEPKPTAGAGGAAAPSAKASPATPAPAPSGLAAQSATRGVQNSQFAMPQQQRASRHRSIGSPAAGGDHLPRRARARR